MLVAYGEPLARRPIAPAGGARGRARRRAARRSPSGSAATSSASGRWSRPSSAAAGSGCSSSPSRCEHVEESVDQVLAAAAARRPGGARRHRARRLVAGAQGAAAGRADDLAGRGDRHRPAARADRAAAAREDEIGHLAVTLNAMLDRLERGVEEKHRLVADASHELRTPLAAMRAELDVSLHGRRPLARRRARCSRARARRSTG